MAHDKAKLERVLYEQRSGLLNEIRDTRIMPLVAAKATSGLLTYSKRTNAILQLLPGGNQRSHQAWVMKFPWYDSSCLWVSAADGNAKDKYISYLRDSYGWGGHNLPNNIQVDHVFNKQRAHQYQLQWIRLAALESPINASVGASFERLMTQLDLPLQPGERHMELPVFLKFMGSKIHDQGVLEDLSAATGIPVENLRRSVESLIASTRRLLLSRKDDIEDDEEEEKTKF